VGKNATSWRRGQSGNPGGRPKKPATIRQAIRQALDRPASSRSTRTVLQRWAEELVDGAATFEDRLLLLKFMEGPSPPPGYLEAELKVGDPALKPRIVIPGALAWCAEHGDADAEDDA
jgi:hypothetical protein